MTATLMVGLAITSLLGALALTLTGVRYLLVRPLPATPRLIQVPVNATVPSVPAPANMPASVDLEGVGALPVEGGVLLNTLWEHLPNADCQSGECGGCKMRLLQGEVRWIREPDAVVDRATHFLACSCEAIGHVKCASV